MVQVFLFLAMFALGEATTGTPPHKEESLLQTWGKTLDGAGAGAQDTPITRVVKLLQEMSATLKKEMDEDKELYDKLACWCNNNKYEKNAAIEKAKSDIASLEANIERLTAKSAELKTTIKETAEELAADKEALATALALRQKQLQAFHGEELDAIQNVENLKAAIVVLSKHHGGAFPQLSLLGLGLHNRHVGADSKAEKLDRQLDSFMRKNNFRTDADGVKAADRAMQKFVQEEQGSEGSAQPMHVSSKQWTAIDKVVVKRAIRSASLFMQAKGRGSYTPPYAAQSGEIFGIMKQLKEEMEADLSEAQKTESGRAALFDELRKAKTEEIAAGEKLLFSKKEELAQTDMDLANAKEDLEEVQASLSEDQKFMMNLEKTCAEAGTNFDLRKKTRLEEIQAVSETIEILTADEARDAMNGAYAGFIQLSSKVRRAYGKRARAAQLLRAAAAKTKNPELSILATRVQLDAFTKIKQMIDEMIAKLKLQTEDEVKKKDWCDSEFQENSMMTMETEDLKTDQITKIDDLTVQIKTLTDEIAAAKAEIAEMQVNEQRASENRQKENLDFQKTVSDQIATQAILAKALDKLATFYDKQFLLQVGQAKRKQAPPVPQIEYKASGGASGVMSMIEKLIYDAKELEAESIKSESEAQAAYEAFVADTNSAIGELQQAVVSKSETKAKAEREKVETEDALAGTMKELEELSAYKASLHQDCDYVLKNFGIRQEARAAEIEALQQAKQILSGAGLGN